MQQTWAAVDTAVLFRRETLTLFFGAHKRAVLHTGTYQIDEELSYHVRWSWMNMTANIQKSRRMSAKC